MLRQQQVVVAKQTPLIISDSIALLLGQEIVLLRRGGQKCVALWCTGGSDGQSSHSGVNVRRPTIGINHGVLANRRRAGRRLVIVIVRVFRLGIVLLEIPSNGLLSN